MLKAWFSPISLAAGETRNGVLLPEVSSEDLKAAVRALTEAGKNLRGMSVSEIARKLEVVARQWQRPDLPERQEALNLLPKFLPFSEPACKRAIDTLMEPITAHKLLALLDQLLGNHQAIDKFFEPFPRLKRKAFGANLAFLILPGNVVGVGVWDMVFCLLCKTPVLVKPSWSEPILPSLFAQTVERFAPELAPAIAVIPFPPEREDLTNIALNECDVVAVYGTDETIESIKRKAPAKVRVVERGHRFSIAIVGENFADERTAELLVLDLVRFDQRGCLSPQICFVEASEKGRVQRFAEKVAEALKRVGEELPPNLGEGEKASLTQFRLTCEMLGAQIAAAEDGSWVIALWDESSTAWQKLSCTARTIHIVAVKSLDKIAEMLRSFGKFLQGVAVAVEETKAELIAEIFGQMGASRICPIGQLQTPPIEWNQDGKHFISELVRWCDLEPIVFTPVKNGWVEIFRGDAIQAATLRFKLEQKGIPISSESDVDPTNPTVVQQILLVPAQYANDARQILSNP